MTLFLIRPFNFQDLEAEDEISLPRANLKLVEQEVKIEREFKDTLARRKGTSDELAEGDRF